MAGPSKFEILRSLEEAGLVRLERNRGVFVRQVSDADAIELYQVRAALSIEAGLLLAPKITDEQYMRSNECSMSSKHAGRTTSIEPFLSTLPFAVG